MLSSTYSITDMKAELETYDIYGYTSDALFVTALTLALTYARDFWMYKYISRSEYNRLAYYNKSIISDSTCDIVEDDATVTLNDSSNLAVDMYVSGYGIADECQIDEITDGTHIELTAIATETANNITLQFSMLSEAEINVYKAEICFGCYEFLENLARRKLYHRKARSESISEGGVTRSTSGTIGAKMASTDFLNRAKKFMSLAGYQIVDKMYRGNSYFHEEDRV